MTVRKSSRTSPLLFLCLRTVHTDGPSTDIEFLDPQASPIGPYQPADPSKVSQRHPPNSTPTPPPVTPARQSRIVPPISPPPPLPSAHRRLSSQHFARDAPLSLPTNLRLHERCPPACCLSKCHSATFLMTYSRCRRYVSPYHQPCTPPF